MWCACSGDFQKQWPPQITVFMIRVCYVNTNYGSSKALPTSIPSTIVGCCFLFLQLLPSSTSTINKTGCIERRSRVSNSFTLSRNLVSSSATSYMRSKKNKQCWQLTVIKTSCFWYFWYEIDCELFCKHEASVIDFYNKVYCPKSNIFAKNNVFQNLWLIDDAQ